MDWPEICFNKNQTITHNPDIDGLGVVISFVTTGWLTLFVVLCNYLFVFDSTVPPFRRQGTLPLLPRGQSNVDDLAWTSNPLDHLIGRIFSMTVHPLNNAMIHISPPSLVDWFKGLAKREQTKDAFTQCVLSLCDVQLITGISMLLSGFLSLSRNPAEIPLADWQMIVNLAWFSNLTHQCGLIFLREHLHQNPTERFWRLVLMTILLVALIAAMAPITGAVQFDSYYGAQPSTPAICFYSKNITDTLYHEGNINNGSVTRMGSFQITTISIIILGLSFVTRLLKLFETTSRFLTNEIRARMSLRLRKVLASCVKLRMAPRNRRSVFKFRIVLLENPLLACYLFLRIFVDIYASVFSDITWVLLSAIFGTKQLAAQRASLVEPNNICNFGQILPIAMLVAAVLTIRQSFMSGRKPPTPAPPIGRNTLPNGGSRLPTTSISPGSSIAADTIHSSEGKDSWVLSVNSMPCPTPGAMGELEYFLSQAKYVEATWLLPTLFNIGVAIFLFFQLIASSGGSDAQELFVSIILSFFIVSLACCAVILVGLAVDECRWASWVIWTFALQPFSAMVLLSRQVMNHAVSFGGLNQGVSLTVYLTSAAFVLGLEYILICNVVARCGGPSERAAIAG